jgi:cytochrome bd-type quinol oxidase subunit 2
MSQKTRIAPVVAALGAAWSVIMGFWLWFTPMGYVRARDVNGVIQAETIYRPFSEVSRYGAVPLVIAAGVALLAAWAAWRGYRAALGALTLLFVGLTVLGGFSIGPNYLPAAAALIVATLLAALLGSGSAEKGRAA